MSLAIERSWHPKADTPRSRKGRWRDQTVNISVVFTSLESALGALKEAGSSGERSGRAHHAFGASSRTYPLPLESPPVLLDFSEKRFRVIASQSPVETTYSFFVPRPFRNTDLSPKTGAPSWSSAEGGEGPWWPTKKNAWRGNCGVLGHEVFSRKRSKPMLDLFYVAVGCDFCLSAGSSRRPATSFRREIYGLHHCRSRVVGLVRLPDLRASPSGEVLRRQL